jgi:hypothetical protein
MSLILRMSSTIISISIFCVGLLLFLVYFKYEIILADFSRKQIGVIRDALKDSIERRVGIGLNIEEIPDTDELLKQYQMENELITSISIFKPMEEGKILYSSVSGERDKDIGKKYVNILESKPINENWSFPTSDDRMVVGADIVNSFGKREGGLLIKYTNSSIREKAYVLLREILPGFLGMICLAFILIISGCYFIFSPLVRSLQNMSTAFREKNYLFNGKSELEILTEEALQQEKNLDETLKKLKITIIDGDIHE